MLASVGISALRGIGPAIDPKCEDAWLLMAAVASPQASVGYIKCALEINPESQRALEGMNWAIQRVNEYKQTSANMLINGVQVVEPTQLMAITPRVKVITPHEDEHPVSQYSFQSSRSLFIGLLFSPSNTISELVRMGNSGQMPFRIFCALGVLNALVSLVLYVTSVYGMGNALPNVFMTVTIATLVGITSTLLRNG